jgi:hypothetical protein
MTKTRFNNIRKYVTATMAKNEARGDDLWWPLRGRRRAIQRQAPCAAAHGAGVRDGCWKPARERQ